MSASVAIRYRLIASLTAALSFFAVPEAGASSTRQWLDGTIAYTYHIACITGNYGPETGHFVGYIGNTDVTYPRVGDIYYAHVVVSTIGNACAGTYAYVEVILPRSTVFEISPGAPVYCFYTNPSGQTSQITDGSCPQNPTPGTYGFRLNPTTQAAWPLAFGSTIEIQFPLRSQVTMSGIATNDYLQAFVQAIDGAGNPTALASQGIFIAPKPPGSRLGQGGADFDIDLRSDIGVYHGASGLWYVRQSNSGTSFSVGFGGTGYEPAPGDYDWDGYSDVAVYHEASGLWFVRRSLNGSSFSYGFGGSGFSPVAADYDNDGRTDFAVYHRSSGLWYVRQSTTLTTVYIGFGGTGYSPVAKDYDGDGKADFAVFHQSSGLWFVRQSSTGTVVSIGFGGPGAVPVPRDYDGDGKADFAVYYPGSGLWYVRQSSTGSTVSVGYGGAAYTPVPADYDGDGKADFAVYHQASGLWFIRQSTTGTTFSIGYGGSGFTPIN